MKIKTSPKIALAISSAVFAAALALSLCLAFCGNKSESGNADKNDKPTPPPRTDIATSADYEYKTDISAVYEAINTTDDAYLLLANKTYLIGEEYQPENVIALSTEYTNGGKKVELVGHAATAAEALIREMRAQGIDNIYVTSGYRSFSYQQSLYDRYFNEEKAAHPDWTDEQIKAEVLTYSAFPGTSEHQTGLCMDLITTEMDGLWNFGEETPDNPYDKGFAETSAFEWLKDNAHKFGFILRYPENKVDITGYSYESWHYRFVGIDAATDIYNGGITLEEYLGK